jgi:hypothetical protein
VTLSAFAGSGGLVVAAVALSEWAGASPAPTGGIAAVTLSVLAGLGVLVVAAVTLSAFAGLGVLVVAAVPSSGKTGSAGEEE